MVTRPEPLDYFLTRRHVGTWAAVRSLIQTCQVRVDGVVCKHYHRTLTADSVVLVDGRVITDSEDAGTLICHKPAGLACSHAQQDAPFADQMLLTGKFGDRARPHPFGKRRMRRWF